MTQRCTNCGAELFAGQQFCRQCGARTAPLEGEAPTQILGGATAAPPPPQPAAGTTALPHQRGTGAAMWGPRATGPQTPIPNFAHTSPLAHAPAEAELPKRRRPWLIPALLVLLLVGAVGGGMLVMMLMRSPMPRVVVHRGDGPPAPPPPPGLEPGEAALDEAGASVTADETVLTKTFEVGSGAVFSVKNTQGDISVQGWDGDSVEVKVTKRGGTADDRRGALVRIKQDDELLSLASLATSSVKVSFEVKVPRAVEKVDLASRSGSVRVSKLEGPLSVSLQNGGINLDDVRGPVEAKTVNGGIEVVYRSAERGGAHEFSTVNGGVSVRLAEGMDADLSASVVNGRIEVDEGLGFQAEKQTPGWRVNAHLGDGGEPLSVKSVNGSVRFRK
jgi:hypothetical protein